MTDAGSTLIGRYAAAPGGYDEMRDADGSVRPHYRAAVEQLSALTDLELLSRAEYVGSSYLEQGITFDVGGKETPFPLDVVPRIITAKDFAQIEAGIAQRVTALEAFLQDIYSTGSVFIDGVMPRRLVTSSTHYHRAAHGIQPSNGVRIHVAGIDLVRGADGQMRVLEDNVRVPSGVSYVLTNRRAMSSAFPETMSRYRIRAVHAYPSMLLSALRAAAPAASATPRSWCSHPACTTPPTSSTPCWPARWASSSSRPATWSVRTRVSWPAPPAACAGSTSSTAVSTTTSSIRRCSVPTRCSASPGSWQPPGPAT